MAQPSNGLTYSGYLHLVEIVRKKNPSWRKGQAFFNVLADVRPDLSETIRGTDIDPFHRDCKLAEFLFTVSQEW